MLRTLRRPPRPKHFRDGTHCSVYNLANRFRRWFRMFNDERRLVSFELNEPLVADVAALVDNPFSTYISKSPCIPPFIIWRHLSRKIFHISTDTYPKKKKHSDAQAKTRCVASLLLTDIRISSRFKWKARFGADVCASSAGTHWIPTITK